MKTARIIPVIAALVLGAGVVLTAAPALAGFTSNGFTNNGWNNGWMNGWQNGWQNGANSGQSAGDHALRVIGFELPSGPLAK